MKRKPKNKPPRRRNDGPPPVRSPPRRTATRASAATEDTPTARLLYTGLGATGTAIAGSLMARFGVAPKVIAVGLGALGAGLLASGDESKLRSVGAGAMSAASGQLALMVIDDHETTKTAPPTQIAKKGPAEKPANTNELPPGALEAAMERARMRLALQDEHAVYEAA